MACRCPRAQRTGRLRLDLLASHCGPRLSPLPRRLWPDTVPLPLPGSWGETAEGPRHTGISGGHIVTLLSPVG